MKVSTSFIEDLFYKMNAFEFFGTQKEIKQRNFKQYYLSIKGNTPRDLEADLKICPKER